MSASHPSEEQLAALAWGGTSVGVDVAEHLADCAVCRAIVAAKRRTEPTTRGPTLAPGTTIGRYRIEACLGAGGMGVVYRAHDSELDRAVALKLVRPIGDIDELAARLRRESRLQARAAHRAVITIFDIGHADGQLFLAMELIEGATLSRWLAAAPRPWRAILDVFREAAAGLSAAHAAGLVHRDFKPDNVLVELRGGDVTRVLVTDFGIARALEAGHDEPASPPAGNDLQLTEPGQVVGTPAYMSPEQFDGSDIDERSDVFSFCVALWEALYGERPFSGDHIPAIVAAMVSGPPRVPPPRAGHARPPRWVADVLLRGLAYEREDRPPTIAALVAPLDWRRRTRARTVLVVGGVALIAGGAALTWYARHSEAAPSACSEPSPAAQPIERARDAIAHASWSLPRLGEYWRDATVTYSRRWHELRATACASPRTPDADVRARCIDRVGGDAAALLVDAIALGDARRDDVLRATALVAPQECLTAEAPSITALHPDNADVRAARLAIAEAGGQHMAGRPVELGRARVRVAAAVFAPLAHELAYLEAATVDAPPAYHDAMRRVAFAAQRAEHWLIAARALQAASRGLAADRDVQASADVALLRAGDPPRDRAYWHLDDGWLALGRNDRAAALAAMAKARALMVAAAVPYDFVFERSIAPLHLACDDPERARVVLETLMAFASSTAIRSSSDMADMHGLHAEIHVMSGRFDAARAELEQLLAGLDPRQPLPDDLVDFVRALAQSELEAGDFEAALATLDRWQPAVAATIGADERQNASVLEIRALVLLALNRGREAEPLARRSLELFSRVFGDRHELTVAARLVLGFILAEIGDDDRAIAEIQRGLEESSDASDPLEIAHGRYVLGDLLLRAGRPRDARALAEQALAGFDANEPTIAERGEARWLLARTLIASDPARARTLIDGALADWATAPKKYAREIAAASRMRIR